MKSIPDVSVVIATRDRPECLERLLVCVAAQDFSDLECIVVDDGSRPDTVATYPTLWQKLDGRFRLLQEDGVSARGPSHARNRGIAAARAPFVAFCDDDDRWTATDHLGFALEALHRHAADFYFANMQTSQNGAVIGADFYGTVRSILTRTPTGQSDLFEVARTSRARVLKHMFLHCDSMVVARRLLEEAGLFWEKLAMAEDRDLCFRLLDRADKVVYRDRVVADYDRTVPAGLCKSYTDDEIRQFVILAMLHAEGSLRDGALRRVARGYRSWMMLELAQGARETGRSVQARELALQSLLLHPTVSALRFLLRPSATTAPLAALDSRPETL